jgi:Asp/Glu/hydantoin racemase
VRILVLNPNTTEPVTDMLVAAARPAAAAGTELVGMTASRGVPYIASRAEAQIGGTIALEMLAEQHRKVDAAIIAAFGDPGLLGARELFDIPVIGMAEAAMLGACMLGQRFGIVTFSGTMSNWYQDTVDTYRLGLRCAGIRARNLSFSAIENVQAEKEEALLALAREAVELDGADVVILGGAPLAGLAPRIREAVPVPLVDPIVAAVKMAEAVVALAPRKAAAGTFSRPPAKPTSGLTSALAARIEHRDGLIPAAE